VFARPRQAEEQRERLEKIWLWISVGRLRRVGGLPALSVWGSLGAMKRVVLKVFLTGVAAWLVEHSESAAGIGVGVGLVSGRNAGDGVSLLFGWE